MEYRHFAIMPQIVLKAQSKNFIVNSDHRPEFASPGSALHTYIRDSFTH